LSYGDTTLQPPTKLVTPIQNASWIRGDIVVLQTTGSITVPPGNGSGAYVGQGGPPGSAITFGTTASAGAPQQAYWVVTTYVVAGSESQASAEQIVNCPAGYVPTVSVASGGSAPSGATGFNTYVGVYPANEFLQNSSATSLGSTFTVVYPLTNCQGANRGLTNLTGSILGMAQSDSTATFGAYSGGSYVSDQLAFGSTSDFPPLTPAELYQLYVIDLRLVQLEISLSQAYGFYNSLQGTTVGLNWANATGGGTIVIADPAQANKVATIVDLAQGVPPLLISPATASGGTAQGPGITGNPGDYGGRVIVRFTGTTLV
jgi:hypothetical protein